MDNNHSFQEIITQSLNLIKEFEKHEKKRWGPETMTLELIKQVGELSKNIIMHEGYYVSGRDTLIEFKDSNLKIADELSDILLMIIRIANYYKIDLEKEHFKQIKLAFEHPVMHY